MAVVVVDDERDDLADTCQKIEHDTKKGVVKWARADYQQRLAYLRAVTNDPRFKGALFFTVFERVDTYDMATISAIARAIEHADPSGTHKIGVFVDGLSHAQRREYSIQLRQRVASFLDVRGVARDESSPLIRLADALAGFVNDARDFENKDVVMLFGRVMARGVLVRV